MAAKVGMYSASHESVTLPIDRGRKVRIALRVNQIAGFVTVPSEKKINIKFGREIKDPSCIELETKEKERSDIFL